MFFTNAGTSCHKPPWTTITLRYLHAFLLKRISWWLIRNGTDRALCHYPDAAQQLKQDGYRKPIHVQTPVGVEEAVFHPDLLGEREHTRASLGLNGFTIGFAGRLVREKGILDIGAAVTQLPDDVQFLVVGDGPAKGELEHLSQHGGWRNRLHLTGHVPYFQVAQYMRAMDCFVLASKTTPTWMDTFPLVVAQAMATGLPVVASYSGAIPYQLDGAGLLFPEGDVTAIAAHLKLLYADCHVSRRLGAQLRSRALEQFSVTSLNSAYWDLLLSCKRLTCAKGQ